MSHVGCTRREARVFALVRRGSTTLQSRKSGSRIDVYLVSN
jgi:hypothetical protein